MDAELLFLNAQAQTWAKGVDGELPRFEEAIEALLEDGKRELAALALVQLERRLWNAGHPDPARLTRALDLVEGLATRPFAAGCSASSRFAGRSAAARTDARSRRRPSRSLACMETAASRQRR